MPRTPEVCSSDFCPLNKADQDETLGTSHRRPGPLFVMRFVIGVIAVMLIVTFQSSLTTVYG